MGYINKKALEKAVDISREYAKKDVTKLLERAIDAVNNDRLLEAVSLLAQAINRLSEIIRGE